MSAALTPAVAQTSEAQKKSEAALRAGIEAQKARRHDAAIELFSRAIAGGALERKQLTFALYRRAISRRAQKQPAQAISDLNSALFFTGDLSASDRASAIEERARAFRDAGLEPTTVLTGAAQLATPAAATADEKPKPRIVTEAPPRVQEPVRVAAPQSSPGGLAENEPILKSAVTSPASTMAVRVPSFTTRVSAAPAASSATSPAVERGQGIRTRQTAPPTKQPMMAPWRTDTAVRARPPETVPANMVARATPDVASPPAAVAWSTTSSVERRAAASSAAELSATPPAAAAAPAGVNLAGVGQFFSSLFTGNAKG
ncbi:MAG: hypothetical protein KKB37_00770, partial [Alphaproteobacteria bacterium]|nr:hypothetical protein [Alphaproteobacteria bacterium]